MVEFVPLQVPELVLVLEKALESMVRVRMVQQTVLAPPVPLRVGFE